MTFASPADFLAHARSSGLLSSERVDELLTDQTLPDSVTDFLAVLKERGILNADWTAAETTPPSSSQSEQAYVAIPHLDSAELFSTDGMGETGNLGSSTVRRAPPSTMSRSTMWTWVALGGFLWLVGFIIFGMWLSGCLH
ncbi:MAG: hypothetical protein U0798_01515 [Gemmataceae bacterium]